MRNPVIILMLSSLALGAGASTELEEAIRSCDSRAAVAALQRRSSDLSSHQGLYDSARVDLLLGETKSAVEKLGQAVERAPSVSDYRLWYSRALFARASEVSALRKPFTARRAVRELRASRQLDPENDQAAIDLILIHLRIPLLGGGEVAAEEIVSELTRRRAPMASFARGILAFERGDWSVAERELTDAAAILDDPRRALFWVGYLYQRQQRWDEAFDVHEKLLALSPHDPRVWYEFARTAEFSGLRIELGRRMLKRYLKADLPSGARPKDEARGLLARLER